MNLRQELLALQAGRILRAALFMGMLTGVTHVFASIDSSSKSDKIVSLGAESDTDIRNLEESKIVSSDVDYYQEARGKDSGDFKRKEGLDAVRKVSDRVLKVMDTTQKAVDEVLKENAYFTKWKNGSNFVRDLQSGEGLFQDPGFQKKLENEFNKMVREGLEENMKTAQGGSWEQYFVEELKAYYTEHGLNLDTTSDLKLEFKDLQSVYTDSKLQEFLKYMSSDGQKLITIGAKRSDPVNTEYDICKNLYSSLYSCILKHAEYITRAYRIYVRTDPANKPDSLPLEMSHLLVNMMCKYGSGAIKILDQVTKNNLERLDPEYNPIWINLDKLISGWPKDDSLEEDSMLNFVTNYLVYGLLVPGKIDEHYINDSLKRSLPKGEFSKKKLTASFWRMIVEYNMIGGGCKIEDLREQINSCFTHTDTICLTHPDKIRCFLKSGTMERVESGLRLRFIETLKSGADCSVKKSNLLRLIDEYSSSENQDRYDNLLRVVYAFKESVSSLDCHLARTVVDGEHLKDGVIVNSKFKFNPKRLECHMFDQSISGVFALSHFIRKALDDKPDEDAKIAYLLLMNEFSALDVDRFSKSGLNSQNPGMAFHFVINYLVYGVGLEKIGSDKIIEALKSSLSSGEVALYDFAERLFDLIVQDINANPLKSNGDERFQIVVNQIISCFLCTDGIKRLYNGMMPKRLSVNLSVNCVKEIDGSWISQYIAFVKDWRNVTEDEMGKVKNFVQLVLKHYSKFDTISDLPDKVRRILMPYVMLILYGLPVYDYSGEHKEWINVIEGMQESKISDLQKKIAEAKFSEVSDKQREIYTKLNVWLDGCVERGEELEKCEQEKLKREGLKYEYEYEYRDIGGKLLKLYLITRKARTNLYRVKTGDLIRDNVRVPWAGWMYGLSVPEGRENDSYTLEVWRNEISGLGEEGSSES